VWLGSVFVSVVLVAALSTVDSEEYNIGAVSVSTDEIDII